MDQDHRIVATYANGVFTPELSIDLPENTRVELAVSTTSTIKPSQKTAAKPTDAWTSYIEHLKASSYHFAGEWNRDALYDRV